MTSHRSPSPGPRGQGYQLSYRLAREQVSKIADLEQQCRNSGAQYVSANQIIVLYLNQTYHIVLPEVEISLPDSQAEVPLKDRILILHYLAMAKGSPLSGKLISYKQLPGGTAYFAAFSQRAITPLVKHFGSNPEPLLSAAAKLGGSAAGHGDVSVTISAFPRVPITLVLWTGDDEVAPNGNVLFDANASDYLPTEDLAVVSESIVWRLVKGI
jgi:hypothetical protein